MTELGRPEGRDHPDVAIWPPLLFMGAVGLAIVLDRLLPLGLLQRFGVAGWQFWLGLVVAIFGILLGIAGIAEFSRAGTNVHPHQPALRIVSTGPYRLTRNPMYLGALLFLLGLALSGSMDWLLVLLVPVAAILHYGVVRREERYLTDKFGDPYLDYLARTKRWL